MKYNIESTDAYCPFLWNSQNIRQNGISKPCCRFRVDPSQEPMNILDAFNSDLMHYYRTESAKGNRLPNCSRCYTEEDSGKPTSRRTVAITRDGIIDEPKLTFLDIMLSNECNLACAQCDSEHSSTWGKTFESHIDTKYTDHLYKDVARTDFDLLTGSLADLTMVSFKGGEPLITPNYIRFMDLLDKENDFSNMKLTFNTNLTIPPSDKITKYWHKCKKINFTVSLDGIGKTNDYIRWLCNWEQITRNLDKWIVEMDKFPNMQLTGSVTCTVYNVNEIPDIIAFMDSKNFQSYSIQIVGGMKPLFPHYVTNKDEIIALIESKTKSPNQYRYLAWLKEAIRYDTTALQFEEFVRYTEKLDAVKGIHFRDYNPELYAIIKDEYEKIANNIII